VRWKVEGKVASEIPVASSRPKRRAFDASTLRLLKQLCESVWAIVQDRELTNDSDLKHQLRRKLLILAENSDLEDLDGLQRSVLEAKVGRLENFRGTHPHPADFNSDAAAPRHLIACQGAVSTIACMRLRGRHLVGARAGVDCVGKQPR
jgi:hypothetical protein